MSVATQTLSLRPASPLLRQALWLDAVSSGAMSLLLMLFADALEPLLGLGAGLLRAVGVVFVPWVAFVVWAATRQPVSRAGSIAVIALNDLWVIASFVALGLGWLQPTALGTAFVSFQALFVGAMAVLQFIGLKREGARAR